MVYTVAVYHLMKSPNRSPKQASRVSKPRLARVFWNGRSQAVRLPKEFRVTSSEVTVHREGNRIVLEPLEIERDAQGWPKAWWSLAGAAPELDLGNRRAAHERDDVFKTRS
jgi:virulence-associated protein VagC